MTIFNRYAVISILGACALAWLYLYGDPSQPNVWRITLRLPIIGLVNLPAEPLVKLATSKPGRLALTQSQWRLPNGDVHIRDQQGALEFECHACVFQLPELGKHPIRLEKLSLNVRRNDDLLTGAVKLNQDAENIELHYSARLSRAGIDIEWSLPATRISEIIALVKARSAVLQQARIKGALALTGSLHWPSRKWSITPDLHGLSVTGLGTERLKTAEITYHCRATRQHLNHGKYHWVNLNQMGRWIPKAAIIAEDAHFKEHPGFNMETIRFVLAQKNPQKQMGGSTITQQLAKNFFTGGERTWLRKLEELLYAVEMENTLGKPRILALYLNTVDLGPGICGVAQASEVYFKRKPSQLNPAQAAWLASIIRNPHRAWQQQYLTNTPDTQRLDWIMGYMPKKARLTPTSLHLAQIEFQ